MNDALSNGRGFALIGVIAVGVAGFFAWRNREQILKFVGNYVDLPEALKIDESHKADESWDLKGEGLNTVAPDSYSKSAGNEHRM